MVRQTLHRGVSLALFYAMWIAVISIPINAVLIVIFLVLRSQVAMSLIILEVWLIISVGIPLIYFKIEDFIFLKRRKKNHWFPELKEST